MTPSCIIATLLMIGFKHRRDPGDDDDDAVFEFKVGGEQFYAHPDFKPVWRYSDEVRPFDIGAVILTDERVLILYEDEEPNYLRWDNYYMFNDPKEAWEFIRNFLQEHP